MSKTRQRRESFYDQGYQDCLKGRTFRWSRHAYLMFYRNGWNDAAQSKRTEKINQFHKLSWWRKLLAKLF